MHLETEQRGDLLIARLHGEIDSQSAPPVQEELFTAMRRVKRLLLDLSDVRFMSSAGLRILLVIYRDFEQQGGRLALVGVSPQLEDVMEITGFREQFTLVPDLESAIRLVKGKAPGPQAGRH